MSNGAATTLALRALSALDYDESRRVPSYPVWLAKTGNVVRPAMVAFGRPRPHDMSTATILVALDRLTDDDLRCAQQLAAPAVFLCTRDKLEVHSASNGHRRTLELPQEEIHALTQWRQTLGPKPLLQAKRGLRQLPLFPVDVHLLTKNRRLVEETLAERINGVLQTVKQELTVNPDDYPDRVHDEASRLVFSAFAAVVLAHRAHVDTGGAAFIDFALRRYPRQFAWMASLSGFRQEVFAYACNEVAEGIDYRSVDAAVLGELYEHTLTNRDSGKYYTPSQLARLALHWLPFEALPPTSRVVHDPTCGSGTFLVHAHERLTDLQAEEDPELVSQASHPNFRLRGSDQDQAAIQIAQLRLVLADAAADVRQENFLRRPNTATFEAANAIVGNPPWQGKNIGSSWEQLADSFVERAIPALAANGLLALVLPASWYISRTGYRGRDVLRESCDILEIWRLPQGTFRSSRQSPAVVLAQKHREGHSKSIVRYVPHAPALAETYAKASFRYGLLREEPLQEERVLGGFLSGLVEDLGEAHRLGDLADVKTGPQPRAGFSRTGSNEPTHLLLWSTRDVPYVRGPDESQLVPFHFPRDCQNASRRGEMVVSRPKVIIPESKDPRYSWRLRPFWGDPSVVPTNKAQMVAAHEDDQQLLDAILAVLSSGFASVWMAENTLSQHISARQLRRLPVPSRSQLHSLAPIGRRLREADRWELAPMLADLENEVLSAFGLDSHPTVTDYLEDVLGTGHAPEGRYRYFRQPTELPGGDDGLLAADLPVGADYRRVGHVVETERDRVKIWVSGETSGEGDWIPLPERMLGYLCREGTAFEATSGTSLRGAHYRVQLHSYLSLDELIDDIASWDG